MKYQCITITPNPEPREPVFRQFAVPVRQVEGMWVPAGRWQEETHLYDAMDMATDVTEFRLFGAEDGVGSLDDLVAPEGWTVVSRSWLPDDYVTPTAEQMEQRNREAWAKWQEIQKGIRKLEAGNNEC